jgi:hypothetical protein
VKAGIIELNVHGLRLEDAIRKIEKEIENADRAVYRLRIIHGYHGGTKIKDAIWKEYNYYHNDKVIRAQAGINEGITELILREI